MPPISIAALNRPDEQNLFDEIHQMFQLEQTKLIELTKVFLDEFKLGLCNYNQDMAMIPSFVTGVPDGTETGTYLALDLGGTNLRVCEVVLNGDQTFSLRQQKYKVSETLKSGEASILFDYLAESVHAFLATSPDLTNKSGIIPLGLTFSFPVEQTALGSGKILTWTKGFSAKNAVGNDVVKLLQDAFDRKNMRVKCVALVNDTVGALLSRAYTAGGCIVGAIFGTGTNGAYVEDIAKLAKMANNSAYEKGGHMIINTEWGAFNNSRSHLPSTPFDNVVDRLSINPSYQAFEKFISGMYLGEISRNILLCFIDASPKPLLFKGKSTTTLNTHYGIDTSFMSEVENAWAKDDSTEVQSTSARFVVSNADFSPADASRLEEVKKVLARHLGFGSDDITLKDAAAVRWICSLVARRAALLSGVAIATVLIQTDRAILPGAQAKPLKDQNRKIGVGVDGSLIEKYPNFEKILRVSLRQIVGEDVEKRVDIGLAKDGSGVGAALCALQATKQIT